LDVGVIKIIKLFVMYSFESCLGLKIMIGIGKHHRPSVSCLESKSVKTIQLKEGLFGVVLIVVFWCVELHVLPYVISMLVMADRCRLQYLV